MDTKQAIAILKQQRDYWSYDLPDDIKRPPAVLRKDLVTAMDMAINCMKKEEKK